MINDIKMMLYYKDYNNIFDIIRQIKTWIIEGMKEGKNKKNDIVTLHSSHKKIKILSNCHNKKDQCARIK